MAAAPLVEAEVDVEVEVEVALVQGLLYLFEMAGAGIYKDVF